jgi:2-polyprenyl-3-methyl-5-hydroxy-6-metoxy-1,4-benzoquinol methylase
MINVVFEGPTGSGKTTTIKKIKKLYEKNYKVGYTNDIDRTSPLYNVIKNMFDENVLVSLNENFNTLRYETLVQAADYLYLREKLYSANNDINLFDRNYSSIYSYQKVLLEDSIADSTSFMNNILNCMKSGEKEVDLMVFFDKNINKSLKRSEIRDNRKYTSKEKKTLKKFNDKLTDFIRYNNSEYKLLVIEEKDTEEEIINKIKSKIDEIIIDKQKNEDQKWYELYKIDIEEFSNPDEYFKYKLKYKKKFIEKVIKYSKNKKVIETGCGTGLMAGYLQKLGLDVTALDLSQKVLDYAKEIATSSNVIAPCKYTKGNILDLKYKKNTFDVSYSNGVLEHFNDEDIIKTLKQQMYISKYVIFGIPSTYFNMNEKMLGNERGLTLKEWKNLIEKSDGKIIEQTSFHYYKFYKRILEVKKWFKPKAFWLFVIEKKDE